MKHKGVCPHPGTRESMRECEEAIDKEMGDGFCTEHSYDWRRSDEFREAARDPVVGVAAQLGIEKELNKALAPYRKKWIKRLSGELEDPDDE